ncbi:MAG: hypothetical protein FJY77_06290, partial [Candidatus Altiarchaeales archaeon]|nr:hypothetical protein [Candidatus Altiarchaeales archaeon]
MKATALFVFLLALTACCSAESTLRWGYYTVNGVDEVQVFDLDKDSTPEVYAVSWVEPTRPMLRAFSSNGDLLYDILVPRPALIAYGEERITYLHAVDLDDDGLLDILAASEIISAGINSHRLYRFERIFEEDLKRYRTDMLWYSKMGYTSGMALMPSTVDGIQEDIYQSSSDFSLSILDRDGKALGNKTLETSIYDVYPVQFGAGRGLAVAAFQHVYVVDSSLKVLWDYNYQDRFT